MKNFNLLVSILFLALTACWGPEEEETGDKVDPALQVKEEPILKDGSYQIVDLKADFHLVEFVPFNNKYIIGGYGGFIITDQDYNFIAAYREPMVVSKIVPVNSNLALVCTSEGIYSVNQGNGISKLLSTPCDDMEIDADGRILFTIGSGILSKEVQEVANIHELNLNDNSYSFYSDPRDSIGTFLKQLEISENGDIWALSSSHTIYRYQNRSVDTAYSAENIPFWPEKTSITTGDIIHAEGNTLYYTANNVYKTVLKFETEWEVLIDLKLSESTNPKELMFLNSNINDIEFLDGHPVLGVRGGIVKLLDGDFEFIKDPVFLGKGVDKIFTGFDDRVIMILNQREIAEIEY